MPELHDHIRATFASAGAATAAFCVIIGPSVGLQTALAGRHVRFSDILGFSAFSLILSPLVFVAFLVGIAALGPVSFTVLRRLGLPGYASASLVAAVLAGLAGYILFGIDSPYGSLEVVGPIAAAGATAGLMFVRTVRP